MFSRLGVFNAVLSCYIFNSQWVYRDITPAQVDDELYLKVAKASRS